MNQLLTRIDTLSNQSNYWYNHCYWLAFAWFGASFIAVLIRNKYTSSMVTKIIRFILYVFIYTVSFSLLTATIYRLTPILYRFNTWPFWRKTHIITQLLLNCLITIHLISGIFSIFSRDAKDLFNRIQNPLGNIFRLLVILCLLILNKYYIAILFATIALVQLYILRTPKSKKNGIRGS